MAHTWKYAVGLGFVGAALTVSCVVKNGDDDVGGAGGQAADGGTGGSKGGTGGTTGGTGGSGAKAGTGGSTAGKGGSGGTAGAATGGSTTGGTGGTSDAGMSGADTGGTSGTGGTTAGTGGTGADTSPSCDSADMGTPYPSCAPSDVNKDDACALCEQKNCCDESNNCYATEPNNVCGWGGPVSGEYSGAGEIGCYTICLSEYVTDMGTCDSDGIDACTAMCTTEMCGLVGDATSALAGCLQDNCASECFGADTCG